MSDADIADSQVPLLVGAWLFYFLLHSLFAALWFKQAVARRWPALMPAYRIIFNICAVIFLLPPLYLTYHGGGPWLWRWSGTAWLIANGLALAAVLLFFWTLRYYDGDQFLGLKQWRERDPAVEERARFRISPLHRYVRHPWYTLALVLIWSRDMQLSHLLTAVLVTFYFWVGSWLEERKLLVYHGRAYQEYRRRVPRLLPLPRRHISREDAEELERDAGR